MSKQLDLTKPLSQEQIDELLTKWPVEKVQYWVEQSSGSEFDEEEFRAQAEQSGTEDYDGYTVPQLQEKLRDRDLPISGSKQELVDRLREDDSQT